MRIKSTQNGYTIKGWGTEKEHTEYWVQLVMIPEDDEPAPQKGDRLTVEDLGIDGIVLMSLDYREFDQPSLQEDKLLVNVTREKPVMN